ncbi:MAG: M20/M25/M40 family metallo-hydrolase [Bacteroidales bacterium]|nr:M20/M25/M40 family metallo-hydrolase [Bacteroidales bacterium]
MSMDIDFFYRMLSVDSTSGKEAQLADMLEVELAAPGRKVETFEVGDGTRNILVSWGLPKVVFCTHLDTVPPYIPPVLDGEVIRGRGSNDAKGQIFSMYEACKVLEGKGYDGFGLLLLAGEETGSFGAKAFNELAQSEGFGRIAEDAWVIVGEPTDNCMASAAKGTKSFEVTFEGKSFHSGYPENGVSAVMLFNDFVNALRSIVFPKDEILGDTTWNIGKLDSPNPQNILSDRLSCRLYFRTTFESDQMVCNLMKNMAGTDAKLRFGKPKAQDGSDIVAKEVALWQKNMKVTALGGDVPAMYETFEGFDVKPVSFGSDAPHLTVFAHKVLCGPGSILTAHRPEESICIGDIETAVRSYVKMYEIILEK